MANASSLNLIELLLPSIQLFKNNQGGDCIRYENCQFNMKSEWQSVGILNIWLIVLFV